MNQLCSRKDRWTFGNWAKASQEKSGSSKGNSVSTGHNQADHPHRSLVCPFFATEPKIGGLAMM
jgi:hypothetical protein